jgi:hypothetical protein
MECPDEGCGGKEVLGEFIVARGDTPPVLDAAKVIFDFMASSVKALGAIGFLVRVVAAGDDRQGAFIFDLLAHFLAVVSLVGRDGQRRSGSVKHFANDLTVVDLPARYREVQWTALAIDDRVNFREAPTAADADRLILLPPFARWRRGGLSRSCCRSDTDCRATSMPAHQKSASRCRVETNG